MRVTGRQTQGRNESEGRLRVGLGGIPPSPGGRTTGPSLSLRQVRRSKSIHVGTRKMVNYA